MLPGCADHHRLEQLSGPRELRRTMDKTAHDSLVKKIHLLTDREGDLVDLYIEHIIAARRAILAATMRRKEESYGR